MKEYSIIIPYRSVFEKILFFLDKQNVILLYIVAADTTLNISEFSGIFLDKFSCRCYSNNAEVNNMVNIASAIRNTVPISLFNRGLAGKIFDEVKRSGAKVVMKNNAAECVLLSPEEYMSLIDEVNDARLLTMASERMAKADPAAFVPAEHLYEELGITQDSLDAVGEVDIE